MPRKTNKTAHVLNLLASGTPKDNEPDELDSPALSPNISIVDNPTNPADPLAGLIRNTLNKEILHADEAEADTVSSDLTVSPDSAASSDLAAPEDSSEAPAAKTGKKSTAKATSAKTTAKSKASAKSKAAPETEETPDAAPEDAVSASIPEEVISAPLPEDTVSNSIQEEIVSDPIPENEPDSMPEIPVTPEPVTTAPPAAPAPDSEVETDYIYINMMERLLEERLLEFMNRFDACTCDRCMSDARALALSNLPPKYIVVPKASVAPLTSFYRNKYSIFIVTELTKASLAVINAPRH